MTSVASSVTAFIFSQLSLHWLTLFSANSRNAAGTSIFGISNFGISNRGISNLGSSATPAGLVLDLLLLTSDMVCTFLAGDLDRRPLTSNSLGPDRCRLAVVRVSPNRGPRRRCSHRDHFQG